MPGPTVQPVVGPAVGNPLDPPAEGIYQSVLGVDPGGGVAGGPPEGSPVSNVPLLVSSWGAALYGGSF